MSFWKKLAFSLIPMLILFGGLELVIRVLDLANPEFIVAPLPTELRGFTEADPDFFWRLKPGSMTNEPNGTIVRVNKTGFRGGELQPKTTNEYRILSLGESTTFGAGVNLEETYSYLLAKNLNELDTLRDYNVLNCGFSAYSSFQMLEYLKLKGLSFKPDMVIVYSELNDYLPSTLRNFGYDETTLTLSDEELKNSSVRNWATRIVDHWALAKFLSYKYASFNARRLSSESLPNPLDDIGLEQNIPTRVALRNDEKPVPAGLNDKNLGTRVKPKERKANFKEFQKICQENSFRLVVIHPAYLNSDKHECLLTGLCREENIPMFDSYNSLHSQEIPSSELFLDSWHPSPLGHERLANDLAVFIHENRLTEVY